MNKTHETLTEVVEDLIVKLEETLDFRIQFYFNKLPMDEESTQAFKLGQVFLFGRVEDLPDHYIQMSCEKDGVYILERNASLRLNSKRKRDCRDNVTIQVLSKGVPGIFVKVKREPFNVRAIELLETDYEFQDQFWAGRDAVVDHIDRYMIERGLFMRPSTLLQAPKNQNNESVYGVIKRAYAIR